MTSELPRKSLRPPSAEAVPVRSGVGREGYALPVALIALIALGGIAAAGFFSMGLNRDVTQNHVAGAYAYYAAEAGMDHYLRSGAFPAARTFSLMEGSATLSAERLAIVDSTSHLYHVRSLGVYTPPEGGTATRELSTVTLWNAGSFNLTVAIGAAGGLHKNGVVGKVSGYDDADPGDCPGAGTDRAGLLVPPGGYSMSGGGGGRGSSQGQPGIFGDPPIDDSQTGQEIIEDSGIDWASLRTGTGVGVDYVYSEDGWPDFDALPADEWPVILVDEPGVRLNAGRSGRGTIIAQHDLTLDGSVSWKGIILVGEDLTSDGNNDVRGSVYTGLDVALGQSVDETSLGNGAWEYHFHSCNVRKALAGSAVVVAEPGTWMEY